MNFSPFVMFDGDCEQAFGYYHSVFGGELEVLQERNFAVAVTLAKTEVLQEP